MAARRKCLFCKGTAQPRGLLPVCSKHGGNKPMSPARRARVRKKIEWSFSQSEWKAHERNVARRKAGAAKAKSWLGI